MTTMTKNQEAAEMIKAQMGGHGAFYMIGAKDLLAIEGLGFGGLQFRVMKNAKKVTHVRVEVTHADTYEISFHKVTRRGLETVELSRHEVYVGDLRRVFTAETGLYLSL